MNQQRIINFAGNVQGVGFRYTVCRISGGYDVTGYVRNMPDRSVQCIAEGDKLEIDRFIAEITEAMGYFINKVTQQTAPWSGQFTVFTVKY